MHGPYPDRDEHSFLSLLEYIVTFFLSILSFYTTIILFVKKKMQICLSPLIVIYYYLL